MPRAKIAGIGMNVPDQIVTNEDLSKLMDTNDEWIRTRTGIERRRFATEGMSTSGLAVPAAEQAIEDAGLTKKDIGLILFATLSPDHHFPGSGCYMQAAMGMEGVGVMDIRNQCSGFLYGLGTAVAFVESGAYEHVLVVGSEIHSAGLDLTTKGRDVAVLFGDGAGAAVISRSAEDDPATIHSFHLYADGRYADALAQKIWDIREHPFIQHDGKAGVVNPELLYAKMNGREVFKYATRGMVGAIMEACTRNGVTIDDIDLVVPHQANMRINEYVAKMLEIAPEKVIHSIVDYGNTTAATIPMAMCVAREQGRLEKGMKVMCVGFGSGFTWGSAFLTY
ncbi:MAG: beta-ketoacyl-ACP synthase III [Myxococcota bacterium]|nr:beta-ketoacyl-ACP synthase III [Myxococcota bacterium]